MLLSASLSLSLSPALSLFCTILLSVCVCACVHVYVSAGVMWIQLDLVFQSFPALISSFPNGNIHNPVDPMGGIEWVKHRGKWERIGKRWKIKMSKGVATK